MGEMHVYDAILRYALQIISRYECLRRILPFFQGLNVQFHISTLYSCSYCSFHILSFFTFKMTSSETSTLTLNLFEKCDYLK